MGDDSWFWFCRYLKILFLETILFESKLSRLCKLSLSELSKIPKWAEVFAFRNEGLFLYSKWFSSGGCFALTCEEDWLMYPGLRWMSSFLDCLKSLYLFAVAGDLLVLVNIFAISCWFLAGEDAWKLMGSFWLFRLRDVDYLWRLEVWLGVKLLIKCLIEEEGSDFFIWFMESLLSSFSKELLVSLMNFYWILFSTYCFLYYKLFTCLLGTILIIFYI